ncbi:MAG TPA: tail fiber protein [Kouleothrix sp.]|uniref:phage tail protein n=1 Tax=Kouleothrix sp. TaxID=2779161 RepID=UPI002C0D6545|nr:tail fiber protein [Kouleothrix sp.]HRC74289.1 tail fiber protein [Kouleothrix sp.]
MSDPYIGEIRLFGGNFAPYGWFFCDGSTLQISQYETLFSLIGTTYGGDGQTTFQLPDLRGRLPIHQGQGNGLSLRVIGQPGGAEQVTLLQGQLPVHNHSALANSGAGNSDEPANNYWSGSATVPQFVPGDQANTNMNTAAIGASGGSMPHENMQPYLAVSFIIAWQGIYPSQN